MTVATYDINGGQYRRLFDLALSLLVNALPRTAAAFTRPTHWKLNSIEPTYAGTPCFHPGPDPAFTRSCSNTTLSALLNAHINNNHGAGLSIAYYDLLDISVLGGAGWTDWDDVAPPVGVCMSGAVTGLDNIYSTTCRFSVTDDDHDIPSAHTEECSVGRPQLRVIDGCYTLPPARGRFRLDDSTSGILTIIGLLIALPSIAFGAYRWYSAYRAQQAARREDGLAVPLVATGGGSNGGGVPEPGPTGQELALLAG